MPSLPPIHVRDSEFESRVATAAADDQPQPPRTQRNRNLNWPSDWDQMDKNARKAWNRANPLLASTTLPQPVLPMLPQQAALPIPKPANWSEMTLTQKENWYKHHLD